LLACYLEVSLLNRGGTMGYVIPDLSHLVDYPVKEARDTEDGFEIEFIDDTVLRSYRQDIPLPTLPEEMKWDENLRLIRVIQSELDTRVQFAHKRNSYEVFAEITLDPNRYSLTGTRSQGNEVFPQRREDDQALPPDPSAERTASGPTTIDEETEDEAEARLKLAEEIEKISADQVARSEAGHPDEMEGHEEYAEQSLKETEPQAGTVEGEDAIEPFPDDATRPSKGEGE
jgi:hypothetical protein